MDQDNLTINICFKGVTKSFVVTPVETYGTLKKKLADEFNVPIENQKILHPALKMVKNDTLLISCGLKSGSKIILMGSTKEQVEAIVSKKPTVHVDSVFSSRRTWDTEDRHLRIIQKGLPDGAKLPNPSAHLLTFLPDNKTITHLRNFLGHKMRMVIQYNCIIFHTDSGSTILPMVEIQGITSQGISQYPGYSILQISTIGKSVSKKLYIYFVPDVYLPALLLLI